MRRFCPSLTDLQAFEVAARHSSFTRAAQELCVTQGAVSKQVKHLEAFVGVELFLRIRQGLVLTEAGRAYLAKIQAGLGQIEAATVELIAHQARRHAEPDLYAHIRRALADPAPDGLHAPAPGHPRRIPAAPPGLRFLRPRAGRRRALRRGPVARQRRRLHRGPGHRARVQPQVDTRRLRRPEDLLAYPLLHHTSALDGWRDWFEQAGCDTRRSLEGARFDQYALLSQAAAAGFGVALIPRCLVEDELRDGRLSVAVELPIRARMGYYLCYPEQKASLPTLQAFRAWLMEVSRAAEPRPDEEAAADALK